MELRNKKSLMAGFVLFAAMVTSCRRSEGQSTAGGNIQVSSVSGNIDIWLTNRDKSALFAKQDTALSFKTGKDQSIVIDVDDSKTYQEIDGFGCTLTGGSAFVINKMNAAARAALLKQLFSIEGKGIGISYLRISIGASDLNDHVYTYDDLPAGQSDTAMAKFSLEPDRADFIPVLKEILKVNPAIKILGSPWSPPTWMKTNDSSKGGSLKPEFYNAYARYFVKYIQAMKAEGIKIDAITIQNEPLHPGNNPSMLMLPAEQALFIKKSLGPFFKAAQIDAKIILYDHNADRIDYPISILKDDEAAAYVDGSAFHLYGGKIESLTEVHNAFPNKNLYFTEQWIGAPGDFPKDLAWHTKTLIIGGTRNWCRNVLEWNLAADPQQNPHTIGGCDRCLGALTIADNSVIYNPAYYIIAHAAKFVRPGSVRIASNIAGSIYNVAFRTPGNDKVLIVVNDSASSQAFAIRYKGKMAIASLQGGAVGTYVWK